MRGVREEEDDGAERGEKMISSSESGWDVGMEEWGGGVWK